MPERYFKKVIGRRRSHGKIGRRGGGGGRGDQTADNSFLRA